MRPQPMYAFPGVAATCWISAGQSSAEKSPCLAMYACTTMNRSALRGRGCELIRRTGTRYREDRNTPTELEATRQSQFHCDLTLKNRAGKLFVCVRSKRPSASVVIGVRSSQFSKSEEICIT